MCEYVRHIQIYCSMLKSWKSSSIHACYPSKNTNIFLLYNADIVSVSPLFSLNSIIASDFWMHVKNSEKSSSKLNQKKKKNTFKLSRWSVSLKRIKRKQKSIAFSIYSVLVRKKIVYLFPNYISRTCIFNWKEHLHCQLFSCLFCMLYANVANKKFSKAQNKHTHNTQHTFMF